MLAKTSSLRTLDQPLHRFTIFEKEVAHYGGNIGNKNDLIIIFMTVEISIKYFDEINLKLLCLLILSENNCEFKL